MVVEVMITVKLRPTYMTNLVSGLTKLDPHWSQPFRLFDQHLILVKTRVGQVDCYHFKRLIDWTWRYKFHNHCMSAHELMVTRSQFMANELDDYVNWV